VLQDSGGYDLPITASGAFTFATRMPSGTSYAVTVKSSPTSPPQICQVANGTGTIAAANVTNVDVSCSSSNYAIHVTVSGLQGSGLVLQIGYPRGHVVGPPLPITSNGSFTLVEPAVNEVLFAYITQQPASPSQACVVQNSHTEDLTTDVEIGCLQYAYVTNAGDNTVSAYVIDPTSGALTAIGAPVATGTSPHAIALYEGTVFVANEGSNDISIYTLNVLSGALTPMPGPPVAAGTDPKALANESVCLFAADAGSDTVSTFDENPGVLTPYAPDYATGMSPSSIALDGQIAQDTVFLYVANNGGSNDISAFAIGSDGLCALTALPGSPFPVGANPLSLVLGAGGTFLYTANPDATHPSISGFRVDSTGALSPLTGSPFPLSVSHGMTTDQTGAYLYVTWGASIVGYAIDATTGALTVLPGFPMATGANANSITIDPSNQFLYVTNAGAASISGFKLDATTGALSPMPSSPFPAGKDPQFIATF
jgi:DNA-binding beta-propeller fold protein YncE